MDTLKGIEKLAKQAGQEDIPSFSVSDKVMHQISSGELETFNFTVLQIFATASAVAASVVGYFSISAWRLIASPLMQYFTPLQETRLW